ncbi:hypothetical protein HO173_003248 [Letharia columbiana]|uniref:Uncharacterized protein n=1 Tax=Letharia columbiana TaxID=112416 RepID=A0A8H6G1J9_9LECA|nr:uncharacterized protein HO173_003248 [Letharia columbiana]KAF6238742.1 hypothetical protein HO173_003248 [Letharia columbiana]
MEYVLLFNSAGSNRQQQLLRSCVLIMWIHGPWIINTLNRSDVQMQMSPLTLLAHLQLFAEQKALEQLKVAVESTLYERLHNKNDKTHELDNGDSDGTI